uniref:Uncharacterized protein n=1 Tax=Anguilla anguilla TaxID=7936 RepID=A0A0E9VWM1_ANGAN
MGVPRTNIKTIFTLTDHLCGITPKCVIINSHIFFCTLQCVMFSCMGMGRY